MENIQKDQELVVLEKEAGGLEQRAQNFQVTSDATYNEAGSIGSWIAERLRKLEARRIRYVKPLNDHVKGINAEHKGYMLPFQKAEEIINEKMNAYRRAEEAKARAEQERIEKEAARIAKRTGVPVEEIIASAEVPETVKATDTSMVTKRWTFDVENESKVPRLYFSLDEVKVNKAIREGCRSIPGIRIYQKEKNVF